MEITRLFMMIGVALVSIISILSFINMHSNNYGYTDIGTNFSKTTSHVQSITNITINSLGTQAANSSQAASGSASSVTSTAQLAYRGLLIIGIIPQIFGLIPLMIQDAGIILGIPETYLIIGSAVFLFIIAMFLAYVFVLGSKRGG